MAWYLDGRCVMCVDRALARMTRFSPGLVFVLALALIAVGALLLLLFSTPQGLGLSDDSIAYIAGARSLMQGLGYREIWLASSQPVTHLPPAYSFLVAAVGRLFGLDPLRGVRLVNGLLFGANVFAVGVLGWQMTSSRAAGLILGLLFAANASLLRLHADALSEPLYIFLSLLVFLSLARHVRLSDPRVRHRLGPSASGVRRPDGLALILCGSLVAAAYLTRYAGLALIGTVLVALAVLHANWRERLASAAIFIGSLLPWLLAWAMRNRLLGGTITNRSLVWHPVTPENFESAIYNVSEFLVPIEELRRTLIQTPGFFESVLAALGLGLLGWLAYSGVRPYFDPAASRPEVYSFVNALYMFGYLGSLIAAMVFFDASTKFSLRILSPLYVSFLVLLVAGGQWVWTRRSSALRAGTALCGAIIMALSAYESAGVAASLHKGGQGYASFKWYDSEAMAFLRSLPPEVKIYTNEPGAVYLYTGRGCYVLPSSFDPVTALPRPGFEAGVALMQSEIRSGTAVLALFDSSEVSAEDAGALLSGLYLAHKSAGDEIYTAAPEQAPI